MIAEAEPGSQSSGQSRDPPGWHTTFLGLILIQAAHSTEEYVFRLWESFPPARFLTGLVSSDHTIGFLVVNVSLVLLGLACWWWPVRRGWAAAVPIASAWVVIELINGVGHPAWSLLQGGYTPGVLTAVALLPVALLLARQLADEGRRAADDA